MNFADITDIAIPAGDVIKIQAQDGTVLWEKPVTAVKNAVTVSWLNDKGAFVIPACTKWGNIDHTCLITSTNGQSWKVSHIFEEGKLTSGMRARYAEYPLYFSKSKKYVLLDHCCAAVSSSSDLLNWNFYYDGTGQKYLSGSRYDTNQSAYSENLNKILTQGVSRSENLYLISDDGSYIDSQLVNIFDNAYTRSCFSLAWGKSIFCATVGDGRKYSSAISSNGINWTKGAILDVPLSTSYFSWSKICYASELGKFFCMCWASGGGSYTPYIAISADGLTWTFHEAPGLTIGYSDVQADMQFLWISSLRNFINGSQYDICISSDGINWVNVFHDDNILIFAVCWSETLKKCCAVARDKNNTQWYSLVSSSNCTSWTKYPILPVQKD